LIRTTTGPTSPGATLQSAGSPKTPRRMSISAARPSPIKLDTNFEVVSLESHGSQKSLSADRPLNLRGALSSPSTPAESRYLKSGGIGSANVCACCQAAIPNTTPKVYNRPFLLKPPKTPKSTARSLYRRFLA
jgi:hypothetical protein